MIPRIASLTPTKTQMLLRLANSETHVFRLTEHFEWIYRKESILKRQAISESFPDSYFLFYQEINQGTVRFRTKNGLVTLMPGTALLLPPYTLIHWELEVGDLHWCAYRVHRPYSPLWPSRIVIINSPRSLFLKNEQELNHWLSSQWTNGTLFDSELNSSSLAPFVKKNIDLNFREDKDFEDIALEHNTTASSLSHSFSKCYGMSPHTYRNRLRLQYAIIQMAIHNKSTTDTCYDSGFQDFSRYYRNFKNYIGSKPSQFLAKNMQSANT